MPTTITLPNAGDVGWATVLNTAVTTVRNAADAETTRATAAETATGAGVVTVAAPTGVAATDTANIQSAAAALATTGGVLKFTAGTYITTGIVLQTMSNFSVLGHGAILKLASASAGTPLANTASVLVIADCTDFLIHGLTIDGARQQYTNSSVTSGINGPVDQFLTVNAASGQPAVTIQDGTRYFAGQRVWVDGGLTANSGTEVDFTDQHLTINSIAGNVLTLSANLTHAYTSSVNAGGAYITTYQTGIATVAGRALADEDMQNGLHLINCQRFRITQNNVRNVWESPIRMGTFNVAGSGCSFGVIAENTLTTGYDQGIAVWRSDHITVQANTITDTGWAGISCTISFNCVVSGNVIDSISYRLPGDSKSGSGIVCEGGAGHAISGNVITRAYSKGINLSASPLNTLSTTTTTVLAAGATGSIAVASSSNVAIGQVYAIFDGPRSEHVTVTAIPDSLHISIGTATLKSYHPSGVGFGNSMPMDISITGNSIQDVLIGNGIQMDSCARIGIIGNNIVGTYQQAINMHSPGGNSGSPSGYAAAVVIEGNRFFNNVIAGGGEQLLVDTISGVSIIGNRFGGYPASGTKDIHLKAVTDGIIANNFLSDSGNTPIFIENGCKRLNIVGNSIVRASAEGIICLSGDALTIIGNNVYSCNSTGIDIRAVTHCIVKGNSVMSNKNAGIKMQDNGTPCTYNRVESNIVRDDASGGWQGATFTQSAGIAESGTGNNNVIANNLVSVASTKVGAATTITGELVN